MMAGTCLTADVDCAAIHDKAPLLPVNTDQCALPRKRMDIPQQEAAWFKITNTANKVPRVLATQPVQWPGQLTFSGPSTSSSASCTFL
jgi:hypothetical protein